MGGRWVCTNKGDRQSPDVRARWCAKEVATYKSGAFFAATPPLEAMRLILSEAASRGRQGGRALKVQLLDAKKAHLHAPAVRPIFVDLPPERAREGFCCRLKKCLYGTRDAPRQWEAYAAGVLLKAGFARGRASAVCFWHPQRSVLCLVHGDDFLLAGADRDLDWASTRLRQDILLKDGGRLGGGPKDAKELRCLNRVLRWTPAGYEVEADPRHAEILGAMLGADRRTVGTPGVKEKVTAPRGQCRPAEEEEEAEPFEARVSARTAKVKELQQQIRDLAAQLAGARRAGSCPEGGDRLGSLCGDDGATHHPGCSARLPQSIGIPLAPGSSAMGATGRREVACFGPLPMAVPRSRVQWPRLRQVRG